MDAAQAGLPYWVAFFATLAIAFVGGLVIERMLIRPVENAPILTIVIVMLGLLVILNSMAGWIYSYIQKPFPSPFPSKPIQLGNIVLRRPRPGRDRRDPAWSWPCSIVFFRFTTLGLAMRAAAQNPVSSRLVRDPRGLDARARAGGWRPSFGAVAGMMVAPMVFLDPNMMAGILHLRLRRGHAGRLHQPRSARCSAGSSSG